MIKNQNIILGIGIIILIKRVKLLFINIFDIIRLSVKINEK